MSQIARKLKNIPKIHSKRPRHSLDSDSVTSLFYPWEKHKNPPIYPNAQTGRTVESLEFYLFYIGIMFLIIAVGMGALSLWAIIYQMPYAYLVNCFTNLTYFTVPSAFLCLPCFWITLSIHNDGRSQNYLPLVMTLLMISIGIMSFGAYFGMNHPLRMPLKDFKEVLIKDYNETMRISTHFYLSNKKYTKAWDEVQTKLRCCGVENGSDWLDVINTVPKSCDTVIPEASTGLTGCLYRVITNLSWLTTKFSGTLCSALLIQCCTFIALLVIYFTQKYKSQDD